MLSFIQGNPEKQCNSWFIWVDSALHVNIHGGILINIHGGPQISCWKNCISFDRYCKNPFWEYVFNISNELNSIK